MRTKAEIKTYQKKWREENKSKRLEYGKQWRDTHKDYNKKYCKAWRILNPTYRLEYLKNNKEKVQATFKVYYDLNKDTKKKANHIYQQARKKHDPVFKLRILYRGRTLEAFKKSGWKKGLSKDLLGCTWMEAKLYLENKFQVGMSWENHGKWHIDHIIPLASAKTEEELIKLCYYTNLQPLWARDNIQKSNSLTWQKQNQ